MTFHALLFCPDEKTARVTAQVLNELEFNVDPCTEPFAAVKKLMGQHFDAIVVDCENEQNAGLLFKSARNSSSNQGALAVAVVEGQAGVANAFRIGANLVLTKPINVEQAKSTLRVARGLLRKGTDGAKPAPVPASAGPVPVTPTVRQAAPPPIPRPTPRAAPGPKPVIPAFQSPKIQPAAAAKTTADPGNVFDVEQEPTPAPEPAEEILLESMEEHPPSLSAHKSEPMGKAAGPKEHPWPPVPKPAFAKAATTKPAPENAGLSVSRGQGSAAAAPAPAREPQPLPAPASDRNAAALTPDFDGTHRALAKAAFSPAATAEPTAVPAPSFAALASEDSESGSASKKGIMVAVVLLLLATAGYFGYSKFHNPVAPHATVASSAPVPPPQEAIPPAQAAPDTTTASPEPVPSVSTEVTHPSAPAKSVAEPKDTEAESDADAGAPEVVVTHPDSPKTLVVKNGTGKQAVARPQQPTTSADTPEPPALTNLNGSDQSAISSIVQSAPVAVPKVAPSHMLRVSQGVTQGLLLKQVQPAYPHQAMQMRVQGAVELQAVISKTGNITSVKVISGDPMLARAAVDAVSKWKYKPYFLDGEPVDIQTQITVNFRLP